MDRSILGSVSFKGEEIILPAGLLLFGAILFFAWRSTLALSKQASSTKSASSPDGKVLSPEEFRQFPLTKVTPISYNTAIYRFDLPKNTDVLGLPIGQHISLSAHIDGQEKPVVRSYTPITSDESKGHFDLIIKAYPTGNISKYVTGMKIGQMMDVRGPKGAMTYTPNMVRHIGMIAGGTGITPMLQISKAVIRGRPRNGGNDKTKVDLIFANVNYEDILLKDELDALAKEDPDFNVYYVLNNAPEKWEGGVGFVTPDIIKARLPAPADDVKILVCGPPPMVSAMKKGLVELGYEKARPVSKLGDQVFCF